MNGLYQAVTHIVLKLLSFMLTQRNEEHKEVKSPVLVQREHPNTQLKKGGQLRLGEQPECAADVLKLCSKVTGTSNFAVIDCLQNDNRVSIILLYR